MQNFGRAIAAFTIWAAAAAALAQTPPAAPATMDDSTATASAADGAAAGDPVIDDSSSTEPAADAPVGDAPTAVAPLPVTPVAAAPSVPVPPVAAGPAGPPPMVAVPEAVYVTHFIAVPADAPPSGLLARLRAALHTHSAGHDAGLVAQALVQRLNHAGVAARYLAPDEPPPVQGWLIGGIFHPHTGQRAADAEASASDGVGAQISITVADLQHSADTPFAIIGAPLATSGEANQWHPYVVPAKLSFERADRNTAIAALAQQIADSFVGNMTALRQADARAISP